MANRPSKIDRLPALIREEIARQRADGRTHAEIAEAIRPIAVELGLAESELPSRAGLARHVQGLDRLAEQVNVGRAMAEALVRPLGDAPEGRQARLNIELMHTITTRLLMAKLNELGDDGEVTLTAKEAELLAKTLDHATRATRTDVQTTLALREAAKPREDKADTDTESVDEEAIFDLPARGSDERTAL